MTDRKRLSYGRYVGRVGTLAVALGVGIAVTPSSTEAVKQVPQTSAHLAAAAPAAPVARTSQFTVERPAATEKPLADTARGDGVARLVDGSLNGFRRWR